MSFERVEGILRKLWGKATDMEVGAFERTPDQQDVRSHPNACVALQVPVKVTIRDSSGNSETCTARTLLVNRRGARFESLQSFSKPANQPFVRLNEILWIEVPSTGKATEGKVIWADKRCNLNGHFEFVAELERARDLFAESSSKALDSPRTPETSPGFLSRSLSPGSLIAEAAGEPSLSPNNLSPGPDAASSRPSHRTDEEEGGTMNMTDRLAVALQEVVESAVHKEEETASDRLVREVKDRMGQTHQAVLKDLRQEITQQVAVLEDQLLQQCRARTEQMLSTTLETALHALSEQMDELAGKTEERVRKIFDGLAEQLEQRSAKALAETTSRIEEQAAKAARDFHGTIAQNVLLELAEKQKVMVGQMQQQIGMVTEQNLTRLRGGLTRTLQELAEASQNGKFALWRSLLGRMCFSAQPGRRWPASRSRILEDMSATQPFARSLTSDPNEFRIALRSLYREVSRRVHPDLTRDASDRLRREGLMRQANQAYEDGDSRRLQAILQEYEIGLESPDELAPAAEVIAAVRGFTREIRLQLTLMERFGNDRMKQHRSLLAQHLLATLPGGAMPEEILNFFDEMDLFLRSGYLEERILWSTFGFSACRWWAACSDCVVAERRQRNEATLFTGFENLALRFAGRDAQAGFQRPTPADLRLFLEGERRLTSTLP